ncbi:hypothetical protein HD557_002323 [Nocardioides luteus]|nr:hypothetical protein [Nocardioides luteus]
MHAAFSIARATGVRPGGSAAVRVAKWKEPRCS